MAVTDEDQADDLATARFWLTYLAGLSGFVLKVFA